jgi:hypothetical protein
MRRMQTRLARNSSRVVLAGALTAFISLAGCAKEGAGEASPSASTDAVPGAAYPKGKYAALESLPDWGGVWVGEGAITNEEPRRKGEYLKAYEEQMEMRARGIPIPNPFSNCLPRGMPSMMALGVYPIEFLFTPGRVTVLLETWMQWRFIYTDGRSHPEDLDPSFSGHSIGHWEGDTLVVETVGIKEDTLIAGRGSRRKGHGPNMRVVERIHLDPNDPDTLLDEMTVFDPDALEEPFRQTLKFKRSREMQIAEFVCAENDRNPVDASGNSGYIIK